MYEAGQSYSSSICRSFSLFSFLAAAHPRPWFDINRTFMAVIPSLPRSRGLPKSFSRTLVRCGTLEALSNGASAVLRERTTGAGVIGTPSRKSFMPDRSGNATLNGTYAVCISAPVPEIVQVKLLCHPYQINEF
ncbi:hypothetical protein P171DRAFT_447866 [Karstenula rhodostoma CBS 690.94]|uniref:Uncharacterized protein n=1 Tax=Karstenula rhodostoma CBS 690.94 TaxID=1392251 RepID=A0A9P4P9C8_9PLEO|nr:hypothetical protein P171DRAFT_447866 [Karstenula rhodostoma CBS 690.94]